MRVVTYNEYNEEKQKFFRKHKNNFTETTKGNSAEYYSHVYAFADGAVWNEVMTREQCQEEVTIHYCKVKVDVDLFRTEFWSTDDADSKYYYEPWNHNS